MKIINITRNTFGDIPTPAMEGSDCRTCSYWQGACPGDNAENKILALESGSIKGKIAYDQDDQPMGYVQYGLLDSFPAFHKLRKGLTPEASTDKLVITCIMTNKAFRGRGVAYKLLQSVIKDALAQGLSVEAIGMEDADLEHLSTGPAALYRKLGFTESGRLTDKYGTNILFRLSC